MSTEDLTGHVNPTVEAKARAISERVTSDAQAKVEAKSGGGDKLLPPLRVEGVESFDNDRIALQQQAADAKAQINAKAALISRKMQAEHEDVIAGIDIFANAAKKGFHKLEGVGDGETGVDKFLKTGSLDHFERMGRLDRTTGVVGVLGGIPPVLGKHVEAINKKGVKHVEDINRGY